MPRLYNPKRVPVPVTLRDGSSTSIPAKAYLTVPAEQFGSADIVRKVKKGLLVQKADRPVAPPAEEKPEAKKPDVGPKAGEDTPAPPKAEPKPPKATTSSSGRAVASEEPKTEAAAEEKSEAEASPEPEPEKKPGRRRRSRSS